jgi:hypothetical protein
MKKRARKKRRKTTGADVGTVILVTVRSGSLVEVIPKKAIVQQGKKVIWRIHLPRTILKRRKVEIGPFTPANPVHDVTPPFSVSPDPVRVGPLKGFKDSTGKVADDAPMLQKYDYDVLVDGFTAQDPQIVVAGDFPNVWDSPVQAVLKPGSKDSKKKAKKKTRKPGGKKK